MKGIFRALAARRRFLLFSSIHSLLLVVLTYLWMNLSFEFVEDLVKVVRVNQVVQYLLVDKADSVAVGLREKLILVNCSYDKMLVPFQDDHGTGTRAIINREMLTQFLHTIRPASPEMIVMDVLLDYPSPMDSAFFAELRNQRSLVISSKLDEMGNLETPQPGLPYACAEYATTSGTFLKYQLLGDRSIRFVAAAMYELTTRDTMHTAGPLVRSPKGSWLNSFIVDMAIRRAHIDKNEIVMWNLGDILKYSTSEEIQGLAAGKIIMIGDYYEFDNHNTLLGEQPGPLIIVNAYLGLLKGIPKITFLGTLLVFLLYFACTAYILRLSSYRQRLYTNRIFKTRVVKFLLRYFSYIVFFSLFTGLLYLFTEKHFELILFALYFSLFEYAVRKYRVRIDAYFFPQLP